MSMDAYRSALRAPVRGLWSGILDLDQAFDSFRIAVRRGLTRAWGEGARDCGIEPDEMTPEEKIELNQAIAREDQFIFNFLIREVEGNTRAEGGQLTPIYRALERWITRWLDVRNHARILACGDRKGKWVLGATEHCPSCLKLEGKVKRYSAWNRAGVYPQRPPNPNLECRGRGCQCQILPTDERATPGPLPRLP